jgi:hypothetical protein
MFSFVNLIKSRAHDIVKQLGSDVNHLMLVNVGHVSCKIVSTS